MALQLSTGLRNARLDDIKKFGANSTTSPTMAIFGNATVPADCQTANAGTLICTIPCSGNADWMNTAASGAHSKNAGLTWTNASAGTSNVATYFRIFSSNATNESNVIMQGNVTHDLVLDNTDIAAGQQVTVTSFVITDGNA
jgi:hypothetical protein